MYSIDRPFLEILFFSKFSKTIVRFVVDEGLKILVIVFCKVWGCCKVTFYPYLSEILKIFNRIRRV